MQGQYTLLSVNRTNCHIAASVELTKAKQHDYYDPELIGSDRLKAAYTPGHTAKQVVEQ